jgi:hypothetical protein
MEEQVAVNVEIARQRLSGSHDTGGLERKLLADFTENSKNEIIFHLLVKSTEDKLQCNV